MVDNLPCWIGIKQFVGVFFFSKSECQCGSVETRESRTIEDRTVWNRTIFEDEPW